MAKSRYEYVKAFEQDDRLLPGCFIVIRIDGHAFHRFSKVHTFTKPNDIRALALMNEAAVAVMQSFPDIIMAYGQSDEYSFVLRASCQMYERRASKLTTCLVSLFTSSYVMAWSKYFGGENSIQYDTTLDTNEIIPSSAFTLLPNNNTPMAPIPLQYAPSFDARAICYPTFKVLKDYISWRQADCHINNLYNTCFWSLVQQGELSEREAESSLCGTSSADKNELLFARFGINYAKLPAIFRKGSVLVRALKQESIEIESKSKRRICIMFCDVIGESFWQHFQDHFVQ